MEELPIGLYEILLTDGLLARLDELGDRLPHERRALHPAEASDRIAWGTSVVRSSERSPMYMRTIADGWASRWPDHCSIG